MGRVPRFEMVGTVGFTWLWVGLLVGLGEDPIPVMMADGNRKIRKVEQ